jgi:hypothetical protein
MVTESGTPRARPTAVTVIERADAGAVVDGVASVVADATVADVVTGEEPDDDFPAPQAARATANPGANQRIRCGLMAAS